MQYTSLLALAATAAAQGVSKGFNYGNVFTNGAPKQQSDFEAEFNRANSLPNASGFSSARLYTMIQGGTTNTPISALQAAIDTQTTLLLGLWASASSEVFQNELDALSAAIDQYGTALTDLIVGISVGSEDLYRVSVQGIENDSGLGEGPDVLVDYIQRTRSVIANTAASEAPVGHVDTWNDWVNGSNSAVLEAVDWVGFNAFPFWESSLENSVENGNALFYNALSAVEGVAGDKPLWITETGWPVSGPTQGDAVASVENSKTFWDEVGCDIFNNYNVWWYILRDNNASPAPEPSFGIVGRDLGEPLFDLTCPSGSNGASESGASSTANGTETSGDAQDSSVAEESLDTASTSSNASTAAETPSNASAPESTTSGTAATFDLDLPSIMKALPDIVAANPQIVKSLPDIVAAHPKLVKELGDKDLAEVASDLNVAPAYVDMIKDAIKEHKEKSNKNVDEDCED